MSKRSFKKLYLPFILITMFALIGAITPSVKAQETTTDTPVRERAVRDKNTDRQATRAAKRQDGQENKAARLAERCEKVKARLQERATHHATKRDKHLERYRATQERLGQLVGKLEENGQDATVIKNHLSTLEGLIAEASASYHDFTDALSSTTAADCTNQDSFKAVLEDVRAKARDLKTKVKAVRDFYHNTLRPSLQALKQQRRDTKPSNEESQ